MRRYFGVLIIIIVFFAIQAVALAQAPITATLYLDFSTINDLSYFDPYPDMPVIVPSGGDPAKLQQLSIDNTTGNVITGSMLMAHINSDSQGWATWTFDVSGRYGDVLANDTEVSIAAYKSGAGIDSWHHPEIKIYFTDGTYISTLRDVNVHSITTSWSTVSIADGNVDGFYVDSVVGFPNVTGWGSYASKYIDKIDIVFGFSDGQGDPTKDAYLHIDDFTLTLKNYVPVNGGGGGSCQTVDDFDFDTGVGGPWLVDNTAVVTISDGIASFPYDFGFVMQPVDAPYNSYTVTVRATAQETDTVLYAAFVDENLDDISGFQPIDIPYTYGLMMEYNTIITKPATLLGKDVYLLLASVAGDKGADVDSICIDANSSGKCAIEQIKTYQYDDETLKKWVPTMSDNRYGYGDVAWTEKTVFSPSGDFGGISGGWYQKHEFPAKQFWNKITSFLFGKFLAGVDFPKLTVDYFFGIKTANDIFLQSPEKMFLNDMQVTVGVNQYITDIAVSVLATKDGANYVQVGQSVFNYDPINLPLPGHGYTTTIDIPLSYPDTYADYTVVVRSVGDKAISFFDAGGIFVTDIKTTGCYYGTALTPSECVVHDPSLDNDSGKPDTYYWDWTQTAIPDEGGITLYGELGDYLSQNTYAQTPGDYYATIKFDSLSSNFCSFDISEFDDAGSIIAEKSVDCQPNVISQTRTIRLYVPENPFTFKINPTHGTIRISDVCLGKTYNSCVNDDPNFQNGLSGYKTDGVLLSSGGVLLNPGDPLTAVNVPYGVHRSYQLQVTASPISGTAMTVISDDTAPPSALSSGVIISDTQNITHTFTANSDVAELGRGPYLWNWNNPYESALVVTDYCITEITSTVYYGGKNCVTIDNADFDNGLQGWTTSNITGVGGYAVFGGAGGSLLSTVVNVSNVSENYIHYPSLSVAWTPVNIHTSVVTDYSYVGGQSMKVHKATGDTGYSAWPSKDNSVNSLADGDSLTFSAYIYLPSSSTATDVKIRIKDSTTPISYWSNTITTKDEWTLATVTFTNNTGATVNIQYSLNINGTAGDDCYYYLDAVQITKISQPQPYIDGDMPWCEWTGTPHASTSKCAAPFDATVHIIGKAPTTTPVSATVTVSSTGSAESVTNQFAYGMIPTEHFDNFTVGGGDMQVSINADAGFELDYICVIPGEFTEPGEPGTGGGITIGDGQCAPPPKTIKDDMPISGWIPGIWIWETDTPSNYEIVQSYSAAQLRYIGCEITRIGIKTGDQLDEIIIQLKKVSFFSMIDSLASILSAISDTVGFLEGLLDDTIDAVEEVVTIAAILGALLLFLGALMSVISLIIGLIYLFWMIPQEFWTALWNSVRGADAVILPLPTSPDDPLYNIYIGFQMFNQTIAPTWLFTITVIVIALGSISLIWWTINRIQIKW